MFIKRQDILTTAKKKLAVIGLAGVISIIPLTAKNASATTSAERIQEIVDSIERCLEKANRPGFPYYNRPEAAETCKQSEQILKKFADDANKNKNLGCFDRLPALYHDIWMIKFLGSSRMRTKTEEDLKGLKKNCYNMNTRH